VLLLLGPWAVCGIKINYKMEVLDREGDSITGLYAVGADAGKALRR